MMRWTVLALVAAAILLAATARSEDGKPTADRRLALAEKKLDLVTKRLQETEQDLARLRKRTEELRDYQRAQASAAEAMLRTLATSEKEGFTFGMNPASRQELLQGWRAQLEAARAGSPAPATPGPGSEGVPPSGR